MTPRTTTALFAALVALAPVTQADAAWLGYSPAFDISKTLWPDLHVQSTTLLDSSTHYMLGITVRNSGFRYAGEFNVCVEGTNVSTQYTIHGLSGGSTHFIWIAISKSRLRTLNPSWTIDVDCRNDVAEINESNNQTVVP